MNSQGDGYTKLAAWAGALAEAAWLAALVAVPTFFNVYTERIFEEDKVLLLRPLSVLALAGLVAYCLETREPRQRATPAVWRSNVATAVLVLTGAYVVSTVLSIAPARSLWGAYERLHGTITWLCYVAVFFAVASIARRRERVERVADAALLASVPAALYGVLQSILEDPIAWGPAPRVPRAHGTLGNPIFLSAFLVMVVPLALARCVTQLEALLRPARDAVRQPLRRGLLCAGYLALLLLQSLALFYSQSRGPVVALAMALPAFFILLILLREWRRLWCTVAALSLTAALLLALPQLPGATPELRGSADRTETRSARVFIWKGVTDLLASDPARLLFGHGPESLFLAYHPFYPPGLAHFEQRDVSPDRAHNETFDALVNVGAAGALAQLALFVTVLGTILQALGVLSGRRQWRWLAVAATVGGAGGLLASPLMGDGLAYSGLGVPVGIVAGVMAYLGLRILRPGAAGESGVAAEIDPLLLVALFTAVVAHFIEIQVGIATATTRLYFFVYAGIAAASALGLRESGDGALSPDRPFTLGTLSGLALALLTFGLWLPTTDLRAHGVLLIALGAGTWFSGALIALAGPSAGGVLGRLGRYAAPSLGLGLAYIAVHRYWILSEPGLRPGATPLQVGEHLADAAYYAYAAVAAGVLVLAIICSRGGGQGWVRNPTSIAAAVVLLLAAGLAGARSVAATRADAFAKLGGIHERKGRQDGAVTAYEEALRRAPDEARYEANSSRALLERARRSSDAEARGADLKRAARLLEEAERWHPRDPDHPANLARLHRQWAHWDEPGERTVHLRAAERAYERALSIKSRNADLRNELATLYREEGRDDLALQAFAQSLEVDARYATTHKLRGDLHFDANRLEEAGADYERAVDLDPKLVSAWSSLALTRARLGRTPEAIAANEKVVELEPDDLVSHRNLAILYQRAGETARALVAAEKAAELAKGEEREALQRFAAALRGERSR